jgi:hypothetical protein
MAMKARLRSVVKAPCRSKGKRRRISARVCLSVRPAAKGGSERSIEEGRKGDVEEEQPRHEEEAARVRPPE